MAELGCDLLLIAAGVAVLGGFGLAVWGMLGVLQPIKIVPGVGLLALGPILLLLWERVAWEPFVEHCPTYRDAAPWTSSPAPTSP